MDEIQLLREAVSNAHAFAELYRLHVTRVYRYHMAHTGNAKDAEDLTSQTFITALEELRASHGSGSFAAWVMGIASKKRLRNSRGSRRELPVDAVLYYQSAGLPTDQAAIQRMGMEAITRALKQISVEHAEAIILTFFGELNISEVSRVLKKSPATIAMLISRGIQDLRTRSSLNQNGESNTDMEADLLTPEDEAVIERLTNHAYQIIPDPQFISELEQTLLASYQPKTTWTFPLQQLRSLAGWVVLIGFGVFLLNWRVAPPSKSITGNPKAAAVANVAATNEAIGRSSPTARATVTRLPTLEYVVQPGDTCTYIAERYGVTIDELITLNRLNETCDIMIDQTLLVPISATATPSIN